MAVSGGLHRGRLHVFRGERRLVGASYAAGDDVHVGDKEEPYIQIRKVRVVEDNSTELG